MIPNTELLSYGAKLPTAFRTLSTSPLKKKTGQPKNVKAPKPAELDDLTKQVYPSKELGALARHFKGAK